MVSEKHREIARELATRIAGGVLNNDDAAYVERYGALWIEEALANAEREGMRSGYLAGFNASGEGWNGEYPFKDQDRSPEGSPEWVKARDHFLSEITNQPGSSSLPADSAPEAGSSPVSGVTNTNPRLTSAGTPPVDAANCESIAQAVDASPSYSEWQPIDSAPKGQVILTDEGTGIFEDGRWYLCKASGAVPSCGDWGREISEIEPASWLPLPNPPKQEG